MPTIPEARLGAVQLSPQASPVDTYSRPGAPRESSGLQLARALQSIQPGITAYLQDRQAKADVADETQARKDALSAAQTEVAAVQKGEVFAGQSKLYQRTYKEQRGLIEGQRIRGEALQAYTSQGLENSTDPQEFDTFFAGFLKDKLEGITDPDMLRGALGVVEQATNNLSLQNAAKVSENVKNGILDDATTLVSSALDAETESSLREKRDFNVGAVMQAVNSGNARARFLQLPGPELRRRITDLVIDKAVSEADPNVLKLLDQQMDVGGKKIPLADGYWKSKRDEVQMRVEARQVQIADMVSQQAAREDKRKLQAGQSALLKMFAQNPYAMPSAKQLAEWEDLAPGLAEQAITIRNKLVEAREKVSPSAALNAMAPFVQDPSDLSKLFMAVRSGTVDPSMLKWGLTTYERASKMGEGDANAGWRSVQANPAVAPFMARFDGAATDPILKELSLDPAVLADARSEFNLSVLEYMEQHPDSSFRDLKQFTRGVFNDITSAAREAMGSKKQLEDVRKPANPAAPARTAEPSTQNGNAFDQFDENP